MRLLNKNISKRDLQNKIKELEAALNEKDTNLSSKENIDSANQIISHLLKHEELFYFIYHIGNKQFSHAKGADDFLGENFPSGLNAFLQLVHPDDTEKLEEFFTSEIAHPKPRQLKFRVPTLVKDHKEQRVYTITQSPIDSADSQLRFCTLRNVTREVKALKDLTKGRERAEEADKLKNTFLSKISQYIRTPMNSIVGFAELLTTYHTDDAQKREYLDVIKRQSKSLLNIVNEIAEIAKYSAGSIEISKTNINLNLVINETIIGFEPPVQSLQHPEHRIETNYPNDEGVQIYADSGRIQQILHNLLNYTTSRADHGKVTIGYQVIGDKIIFRVSDDNANLRKKERKNFFSLYLLYDESEHTRYEDTGIGLAIAKTIVKALGGKIWVEPDAESGTSYYFSLPYQQPIEQNPGDDSLVELPAEEEQYDWRNSTILIVDDEEVNALFLEALLQNTKARLLFAKNGFEAVELCKTITQLDLVLMDILMPGMNGLKATQEIRKFNTQIPIIAQTALTESEDYNQCIQSGCNEAISKPIEVEKLLRLLSKFL